MKYYIHMIIPCQPSANQPGCSLGFFVGPVFTRVDRAMEFADQHHMLTGHQYEVWETKNPDSKVYTGRHNPSFLV